MMPVICLILLGPTGKGTPALAGNLDPAGLLAQCRSYIANLDSEEIARKDEYVAALIRCVDLGMDPPLKTRLRGGTSPSAAADTGRLPSKECPPFDSCLYSTRINKQSDKLLCYPTGTLGPCNEGQNTDVYYCVWQTSGKEMFVNGAMPSGAEDGCHWEDPTECCVMADPSGGPNYYECRMTGSHSIENLKDIPLGAILVRQVPVDANCPYTNK